MFEPNNARGDPLWYFAYGSNMSPVIFVERRGMHPLATRPARLDGYRLCFSIPVGPGERGVANVELVAGAHIWGVAYLLGASECDHLDRTEGVPRGLYESTPVVFCVDEERVEAFTYRSSFASDRRKPSLRYLGLLLDGARRHGLPIEAVPFFGFGDPIPFGTERNRHLHFKDSTAAGTSPRRLGEVDRKATVR